MLRETKGLVARRKSEGCIAVEMELAGVQAACDFYHLELYDFLEAGDVLEESGYGNHPEILRFFNRIADALMEDSLVRGEAGGSMPPLEERMYAGWSSKK